MKIAEIPVDPAQYLSSNFAHETHDRSPGLHLSNIIQMIQTVQGNNPANRGKPLDRRDLEAYRTFGFLFERVLFDVILQDRLIERPGEFTVDGITLTPDAIDTEDFSNLEAKCTWRGMPDDVDDFMNQLHSPERFNHWLIQMKAQCKAIGTLNQQLWTFWVNGNYKDNRRPTLRKWMIEFTKDEIRANWDMLVNFAKRRGLL